MEMWTRWRVPAARAAPSRLGVPSMSTRGRIESLAQWTITRVGDRGGEP
jgi:hypothetical protein